MVNEIIFALLFFGFLAFCIFAFFYYAIYPVNRKIIDYRGIPILIKWVFRIVCGVCIVFLVVGGIGEESIKTGLISLLFVIAFLLINYFVLNAYYLYRLDLHTNSCLVLNLRDQIRIDEESAKLAEQYLKERNRLHRFLFFWRGTSINEIKRDVFPEGYEFGQIEKTEEIKQS